MSQLISGAGPFALASSWYDTDGVLDPDVNAVTIGIVDGNGDVVVAAGTATTDNNDGTYDYTLADIDDPDQLTVTWTATTGGAKVVQRVELIGSLLFTVVDARAFGAKADATSALKPLASTTEYTTAMIRDERVRICDDLELWTGRAWIPRYARLELRGTGTDCLDLRKGLCRTSDGYLLHRPGAQLAQGIFSPKTVSVGDLFAGALIPGLLLVGLYIAYQMAMAVLRPETSPAMTAGDAGREDERPLWSAVGHALLPPLALIVAVLGSILAGVATPTEAAAVGAVGALLLAGLRLDPGHGLPMRAAGLCLVGVLVLTAFVDLRVTRADIPPAGWAGIGLAGLLCLGVAGGVVASLWRTLGGGVLVDILRTTTQITSMVFVILIGAAMFSLVFRGLGGDDTVHALLTDLPGGVAGAMAAVMLVMFLLGFFLDFIEITFVVVPVVAPVLLKLGLDPVWLGVMMAVNLQTSFLTPPFGFALFYLRGVAPPEVTTMHIYRGIVPFVALQIVALGALALFPALATWLPKVVFGG